MGEPVALPHRLTVMLAALWWGGLTALAFVAVPMLFARLGSPAVAGPVAAALFAVIAKVSLVAGLICGFFLMRKVPFLQSKKTLAAIVLCILAVLAATVQDTWVAQQIVTARASGGNLKFWHGLGTGLVLLQWLAAGWTLWVLASPNLTSHSARSGQQALG